MKIKRFPLIGFCLLAMASLAGCASIPKDYVVADRLTLEWSKPYLNKAIGDLPPGDEKDIGEAKMRTWESRVKSAEKATNDD